MGGAAQVHRGAVAPPLQTPAMGLDEDLRELAARQHGLVGRSQARSLGARRWDLQRRIASGDWVAATPRVMRLAGAPPTQRQDAMAAVLDAGPAAVLSHASAAALWDLPGFSFRRLEVSRLRGLDSRQPLAAVIHRPRSLPAHHTTAVDGIPSTSLGRTLFDLAGTGIHPARVARLVDGAVTRSPSLLGVLHGLLEELAARGRPGLTVMRELLAERPPGAAVVASGLEARFEQILAASGEAPLSRQVDLGGHEWTGRVDFLDRELRLVFEVDSVLHHTSRLDRLADAARDAAFDRLGMRVVRVPEHLVWGRPAEAVQLVRAARRRRRQERAPAA
jgi:very-short-patch-repair endonuclease